MKLFSIFFAIYILCNSLFSQENKTSIDDNIISWSKTNKLQWHDYKGTMNPEILANAVISYKIDIIPENVKVDAQDYILNDQDLTVRTNFYKNHTWSISEDVNLLNHEQLHFDIAELYARKIKQQFAELKSTQDKRFSTNGKNTMLIIRHVAFYKSIGLLVKKEQAKAKNNEDLQTLNLTSSLFL